MRDLSFPMSSVGPLVFSNFEVGPPVQTETRAELAEHDCDGVYGLRGHADLSDPIVGKEQTILDDNGPGALAVRPLPSPQQPSREAMLRHFLTHVPYAPWCPFCVGFRKPNLHHRRCKPSGREIPLLVADYAFVRNSLDDVLLKLPVVRVYPYGLWFVTVIDRKGR